MKRFQWMIAILLVTFAQFAHADTFDITQITITVFFGNENVQFDLSGPGTKITGFGGIACQPSDWCTNPVLPPGSVLPNIGQIGIENFNDAKIGGTNFGAEFGFTSSLSVDVLGSIILPVNPHGSTFTACVPATMSGPVTGNAGSGETFTQFTLQIPVGGRFCTTWFFGIGPSYQFERGMFFVSTVPEPGTLGMMGSGLVAVFGAALRKWTATGRRG